MPADVGDREQYPMRTLTIALALLAAVFIAAPAQAELTDEQLAAAALTAEEIGADFTVVQSGAAEQLSALGVPSFLGVYQRVSSRSLSFDVVMVLLVDATGAEHLTGQDVTGNLELLKDLGVTLTPTTPPAIGEDTMMVTVAGAVAGFPITGDIITWRQSGTFALVGTMGSSASTAVGYAEQQRDKLAAIGE
jgi:hypothetical protein